MLFVVEPSFHVVAVDVLLEKFDVSQNFYHIDGSRMALCDLFVHSDDKPSCASSCSSLHGDDSVVACSCLMSETVEETSSFS